MVSWKTPISILEAPGLDFGGFGCNFFEIWGLLARKMQAPISNLKLKLRNSSLELELANHEGLFYHNGQGTNGVGGGGPPPGGFQSAAHRRWQRRAKSKSKSQDQTSKAKSQLGCLKYSGYPSL